MSETPAGWYPDPSGQAGQRYWDGTAWTDQVAPAEAPVRVSTPEQVRRQVEKQAGIAPVEGGGGGLFDSPVLVVNQKAKLIEVTNEYAVYGQNGGQIGSVVEVGQNAVRKVLRVLTDVDQFLSHRLEVRDVAGRTVLSLRRPAKFFKSTVVVSAADGRELGQIRQDNMFGKIRFAFEVDGQRVGGIQAENWRAWDFAVVDAQDAEVARIKKTWEGLVKAAFTTADNYVVRIHRPLEEPLRSLVIASALTVDTALKQDSK